MNIGKKMPLPCAGVYFCGLVCGCLSAGDVGVNEKGLRGGEFGGCFKASRYSLCGTQKQSNEGRPY